MAPQRHHFQTGSSSNSNNNVAGNWQIGGGDTTYTKIFVGGLAWETRKEALRKHFEMYGEILEAVVITDKHSGRSKGYGFVTFKDPESADKACLIKEPMIDGRKANCNLAYIGAGGQRSNQMVINPLLHQAYAARFRAFYPALAPGSAAYLTPSTANGNAGVYFPQTQYTYPYYGYPGTYSQESIYPPLAQNYYGFGTGGAQQHHPFQFTSQYIGTTPAGASALYQGFYPSYYTQGGGGGNGGGYGGGYGGQYQAVLHQYPSYQLQQYTSGIAALPPTSNPAAGVLPQCTSSGTTSSPGTRSPA